MIKEAYEKGVADALAKLAIAMPASAMMPSLGQKIVGSLVRNPNLALAGAGALGGALLGGGTDENGQPKSRLESALLGGALGYGAGHLGAGNALRKGIVGKNWLGEGVGQYARDATRKTFTPGPRAVLSGL